MIENPILTMVDILGIQTPERGRSCDKHKICGLSLEVDMLVRILKTDIINEYNADLSKLKNIFFDWENAVGLLDG